MFFDLKMGRNSSVIVVKQDRMVSFGVIKLSEQKTAKRLKVSKTAVHIAIKQF